MAKKKLSRQTRDGDTEKTILKAATIVFVRHGTAGARMQEIAEEAGVNQALLHYYFRSKERLSEAVFREIAGPMFGALVRTIGGEMPLAEKIDKIVSTYLDVLSQNPFLPGYILSELHHHPERIPRLLENISGGSLENAVQPALRKLESQLTAAARAGKMRRTSATQFIVNILALCVFPFAARPMLRAVLGIDNDGFATFIEERRKELPAYIHSAIRP